LRHGHPWRIRIVAPLLERHAQVIQVRLGEQMILDGKT
jgi:hypothetical protein